MTLRKYMLKTAAVDQLIRLNEMIKRGSYQIECLIDVIERQQGHRLTTCNGDCNKCMVELLEKEMPHGTR